MIIAEKAGGTWVRHITSVSICITKFGTGCVFIVVCGTFFQNIFESFDVNLSSCDWTVIAVALITPLCWFGSPKDFWWVSSILKNNLYGRLSGGLLSVPLAVHSSDVL